MFEDYSLMFFISGNIFLLIASPSYEYITAEHDSYQPLRNKFSCSELNICGQGARMDLGEIVSPHQEYISRHVTDTHKSAMKTDNRVSFVRHFIFQEIQEQSYDLFDCKIFNFSTDRLFVVVESYDRASLERIKSSNQ